MENEKDLLKKDLENINSTDKEGLEKFKEDAEMLGHEDIAALAQEKIAALNTQAEAIVVQPAERIETIQNLGGSSEELIEKVAPVQDEIEKVQVETQEKIEEVQEETPLSKEQSEGTGEILKHWNNKMQELEDNNNSYEWRSKKVSIAGIGDGTNEDFYHTYKANIQKNIDFYTKSNDVEILKNDKTSEGLENKVENPRIQELKSQIEEMRSKALEAVEDKNLIFTNIDQLIEAKGYETQLKELNTKIVQSENKTGQELLPNKEIALLNLNKIMDELTAQEQNGSTEKLKRQLDELITQVNSTDEGGLQYFQDNLVERYGVLLSKIDIAKISPQAATGLKYQSDMRESVRDIENKRDTDSEIVTLRNRVNKLQEVIDENSSYKIERLQKELESLEK